MKLTKEQWDQPSSLEPEFDTTLEVVEVTQLPSNFTPYGVDKLYLRGLTFGEVKTLSKVKGSFSSDTLVRIFRPVITGIDPMELTPLDFKAIILLTSYYTDRDHKLVVSTQCPRCEKPHISNINIQDMEFGELPEEKRTITLNDELFTFHPILMKHRIRAEQLLAPNALDYLEDLRISDRTLDEDILYALFSIRPQLADVDDQVIVDKYFELEGVSGEFAGKILDYSKEAHPELEPLKVQCSGCGFRFSTEVLINPFAGVV